MKLWFKIFTFEKNKIMNNRQKILFTTLVLVELASVVLWFMGKIDLIVFVLIMAIVGLGIGWGVNKLSDSEK